MRQILIESKRQLGIIKSKSNKGICYFCNEPFVVGDMMTATKNNRRHNRLYHEACYERTLH